MPRLLFFTLLICFLLAGCAPSAVQITTTPAPTQTQAPTFSPVPTQTAAQLSAWNSIAAEISQRVSRVPGVDEVSSVFLEGSVLNIALQTHARDLNPQAQIAYDVIRQLSWLCTTGMSKQIAAATGVHNPSIRVTAEIPNDPSIFLSLTTFEQCYFIASGSLGFKDWQTQSNFSRAE